MTFRNPILGGTVLLRPAIQSPNYTPHSTGWTVKSDGSAEFNNITIRGGETVSSTDLYYNGTPASGNLTTSIASAAGTDDYGNSYFAGVSVYDNVHGYFINLISGAINVGKISDPTNSALLGYGTANLGGGGSQNALVFGGPGNDPATVIIENGTVAIIDPQGTKAISLTLSGIVFPGDTTGGILPTQVVNPSGGSAPAYNTNWSANTSYGTLGTVESLRFSPLATGHTRVHGAFKTGASAPATNTVFSLPSGYYRTDRAQMFTWHGRIAPASNETIGTGSVNTSGGVSLSSTNTGSTSPLVANSTYWLDFIIDGPGVQ